MNKKFRLLLLSGFLLSGMSFAQERIVGGVDVVEGEFPAYVALLKLYGEEPDSDLDQYCGATAIAPNKLLTAAHCEVTPGHVAVPGAVDYTEALNDSDNHMNVISVDNHPDYDPITMDNDIAIVTLESSSLVNFVPLYEGLSSLAGRMGTSVGLGALASGGSFPDTTQQVDIPIISNETCNAGLVQAGYGEEATSLMVCAGFAEGGKDSCQGDSGGPLFVKDRTGLVQVGVVSWGYGCAVPNQYGIYARVSEYTDFIKEHAPEATFNSSAGYDQHFITTPGSACKAAIPADSIRLQSKETGLTNVGNDPLGIVCPVNLLMDTSLAKSQEVAVSARLENTGSTSQNVSCSLREYLGSTKQSELAKSIDIASGSDNRESLVWNTDPSWTPKKAASVFAVTCELPSQVAVTDIEVISGVGEVASQDSGSSNSNSLADSFTYGGHTYQLIKVESTFSEAASDAAARSFSGKTGYLVEIGSAEENQAVFDGVMEMVGDIVASLPYANDGGSAAYIWTGGTDQSEEGVWMWQDSGEQFWDGGPAGSPVGGTSSNWGKNSSGTQMEPDDYQMNQDGLGMALESWPYGSSDYLGSASEWNDIDLNNVLYYLVEFDTQ